VSVTSSQSAWLLRRDLEWVRYAEEARWVIHDPIRSTFFYLDQIEAAAARMFDGRRTAAQIVSELGDRFDKKDVGIAWLESLAAKLLRSQLLVRLDVAPAHSNTRTAGTHWSRPLRFASSFMSVRIPLLNPQQLTWLLRPPARLLFSKAVALMVLLACVACFLLVCNRLAEDGVRRLPVDLFQPSRWWIVACLIVSIKILHELGHLMACVRWNVPSREVGVLLLSFLPNPYCDTTDAWRLPSKWKRASIAAAGIYIELMIACVAALIWINHRDPLVHTTSAWVMALCSINTILINGNPFLRYDGYYILSDLWGIPNLSNRSREACARAFQSWLQPRLNQSANTNRKQVDFGSSSTASRYENRKTSDRLNTTLLILYSVISFLYRWSILLTLMWVFWIWLTPLGLGFIPVIIASAIMIGMVSNSLRLGDQLAAQLYRPHPIRWLRLTGLLLLVACFVWVVVLVPIPSYVRSRAFLDFGDKEPVYAPVDCYVESMESPDSIARMQSASLQLEALQTSHAKAMVEQKIAILKRTKTLSSNAALELPSLDERLLEIVRKEEILNVQRQGLSPKLRDEEQFLSINLPKGRSLTSSLVRSRPSYFQSESIHGARLKRGTLLGWRAKKDPDRLRCLISEEEFKRVRVGMRVEGMFDCQSGRVLVGWIEKISNEPVETMPSPMLGDTFFSVTRNQSGELVPEQRHYMATIALEPNEHLRFNPAGALADVRIEVDKATLLEWIWRQLRLSLQITK
jgi:putative peptide zinc metalloprotease protein